MSDHQSAFWDLMATLADIYQIDAPANDGISYLPSLLGKPGDQKEHDYLYWEFHEQGGRQAVLQGNWKAVRHWVRFFPRRRPELYNLADDPGEKRNVAEEYPDTADAMGVLVYSVALGFGLWRHLPPEVPGEGTTVEEGIQRPGIRYHLAGEVGSSILFLGLGIAASARIYLVIWLMNTLFRLADFRKKLK